MIYRAFPRVWALVRSSLFGVLGMLAFAGPALAHYPIDPDIEVTPVLPEVSVSVPPKVNYASFNVKVTNNTGVNIAGLWLFGVAKVLPANTIATFKESSAACVTGNFLPWAVKCQLGTLPKNAVLDFTVTFLAPAAGDQLRFGWAVSTLPPSLETGAANVTLTTQTAADIAAGFKTIVPKTGGTFYTGADGSGGAAAPGGVATKLDPFTTTVIVPNNTSSTTAVVTEAVVPSSCSPNYGQCYESNLTIPGSFSRLVVYLRIDVTRISPFGNLANAVIFYEHTPGAGLLPVAACAAGLPAPGKPCIESRQKYSATTAPTPDWKGDWEFKIQALDNGRYIN